MAQSCIRNYCFFVHMFAGSVNDLDLTKKKKFYFQFMIFNVHHHLYIQCMLNYLLSAIYIGNFRYSLRVNKSIIIIICSNRNVNNNNKILKYYYFF